jgi:5-formyltetrahydrofolate cyclo-ligase
MKRDFFSDVKKAKEEMRRTMRARLRDLGADFRAEASLVICETAAQTPAFIQGQCIALFAPLPSEPDIHPLIEEAWAHGKQVLMPLMIKHGDKPELDWHAVTNWDDVIVPGPFGLREPDPLRCERVATSKIDCAFIPGLAFDAEGYRLGRGGGFYDYFLGMAASHLPRFGLMFACQQVPNVPREPHDQALPDILTEDGAVCFR